MVTSPFDFALQVPATAAIEPEPAEAPAPVVEEVAHATQAEPAPQASPSYDEFEQFGAFRLRSKMGSGAASHPAINGLDRANYTHREVSIDAGDGNPIKPQDMGMFAFRPYFNDAGVALYLATEVYNDLRTELRKISAE